MRALILADGDSPTRAALDARWPGWDAGIDLVVAADGGARLAPSLGLPIDLWVGDGDSLGESGVAELVARGVTVERSPRDKDESDTELAIHAALDRGATDLIILGGFGGPRLDHALANIGLLALGGLDGIDVVLLDGVSRVGWLTGGVVDGVPRSWPLAGQPGDLVTLLPMSADVDGVTTTGLAYPLDNETLPAGTTRGLSNVIASAGARVTLRSGRLLVIESPATLDA